MSKKKKYLAYDIHSKKWLWVKSRIEQENYLLKLKMQLLEIRLKHQRLFEE